MNLHEMYGALAEKHEQECAKHRDTVDLLRKVIAGEVIPSDVVITGYSWVVAEEVPQATTDAIHEQVLRQVKKPGA